jgi:hypothetical protein
LKNDVSFTDTNEPDFVSIELTGSESDNEPSTSAGVRERRKRNVKSKKETEFLEVMTKAFRRDYQEDEGSDITKLDDISIFLEHIGRQLRALKDSGKVTIMQNSIQTAIFKCQMTFMQEAKNDLVVIADDDSDNPDVMTKVKGFPSDIHAKVVTQHVQQVKPLKSERPKEGLLHDSSKDIPIQREKARLSVQCPDPTNSTSKEPCAANNFPSGSGDMNNQSTKVKKNVTGRKSSATIGQVTTRMKTRQKRCVVENQSADVVAMGKDHISRKGDNLPDLP